MAHKLHGATLTAGPIPERGILKATLYYAPMHETTVQSTGAAGGGGHRAGDPLHPDQPHALYVVQTSGTVVRSPIVDGWMLSVVEEVLLGKLSAPLEAYNTRKQTITA